MSASLRESYILEVVKRNGRVIVNELAIDLNVSVETIRRDLSVLDRKGELKRTHGGAISRDYRDVGTSFIKRAGINTEQKIALVEQVIDYLFEGMVIGLDASSSSWLLAQRLPDIRCTVVTNSLNNINVLASRKNVSVIGLGGNYSEKYKAFYGVITKRSLQDMTLDISVISCAGFDEYSGVWDSNEYNYDVKKKLVEVSNKVVLIADKSKYGKKSLLKICDFSQVDILASDVLIDNKQKTVCV